MTSLPGETTSREGQFDMAMQPQFPPQSDHAVRPMSAGEKKVIIASSLGTVFEWYDFYLYGSLAVIVGAKFFSQYDETTRNIFALLAFAAGFLVRPFGAIVFGRLGDLVGRKYTFLITILIMGVVHLPRRYPADIRPDRLLRRCDPDRIAPAARSCPGRRIRRRRHLCRRARAARPPRVLHKLDPDHRHHGPVPVTAGHRVHPGAP